MRLKLHGKLAKQSIIVLPRSPRFVHLRCNYLASPALSFVYDTTQLFHPFFFPFPTILENYHRARGGGEWLRKLREVRGKGDGMR